MKIETKEKTKNIKGDFYKEFLNLMADDKIQLPLKIDNNYKYTINQLLDYYCMKSSEFLTEKQMNVLKIICHSIKKMIDEDEVDAMRRFERLMELKVFRQCLNIIEDELPVDGYGRTNVNLFRLRCVKENRKYKRKELFHDPKTDENYKRRKPYRYSLDSKSSLYLSTTVHCCYKELGKAINEYDVVGSLFRINPILENPLFIVDLGTRPIDYVKNKNSKNTYMGYKGSEYIFVYPFIAACSVVVPNKEVRNIMEYKISNVLYRWLVKYNKDKLCGIRYFSCHDDFYYLLKSKGNKQSKLFENKQNISFTKYFINYVFAIGDEFDDLGYCNKLKSSFMISNPKFAKEYATIKEYEQTLKYSKPLLSIDK